MFPPAMYTVQSTQQRRERDVAVAVRQVAKDQPFFHSATRFTLPDKS